MTLEEKRSYYLRLLDKASALVSSWETTYGGPGFFRKMRRLMYTQGLLPYVLSRLGHISQDVNTQTFWGYPMRLPGLGSDAFRLSTFGTLGYANEDKLTRFFIRTLQPSDVLYDVGASYGFYTYLALEFVTEGEVHAFEPLPRPFYFLRHNTQEKSQCILNNCVLSDQEGKSFLYQGYPSSMSSTIVEEVVHMNSWNTYEKIQVVSTTLDSYIKINRKPTFLKIDAEGAERLIIKGGKSFFTAGNPTIAMEVWGGDKGKRFSLPAIQELSRLGYKAYEIAEDGSLREKRQDAFLSFDAESFDNLVFRK